ncbi:KEOPS complex subunit Pcc1 [Halorubrum vacuolatum]|uniref:KEOPS complex subunit Pcc1 n=1 Tax=Halorubrum vacuolatum TaxID=63740 RepID=A0A238WIJ2_HALVU|nr:KEOPS complex subunit Pcc1 [Halorubrum vacuolatum]SNR46141.1 hypothetical protein SAMN06264855_10818 [Halorubrum vacuolatum]
MNPDGDGRTRSGGRSATVRTTHTDVTLVAEALAPDNTDSMNLHVDGDAIVCTIERPTTGGLRSTTDDYVVNLQVADRVGIRARTHRTGGSTDGRSATDQRTSDDADGASSTTKTSTNNE